jgi:hypothetical protein
MGHMSHQSVPPRAANVAASLIRTWVPIFAGGVLTWVSARSGLAFSPETTVTVGAFSAMGVAAAYYWVARMLESARGEGGGARTARRIGTFMLGGIISKPVYLTEEEYARLKRLAP